MDINNSLPPNENNADRLYSIIKGGLGSIPVAGSMVAELFGLIFTSPISKRRDEWMLSITHSICELEKKTADFEISTLITSEEFTSYLLEISQVAIKTHQEEKLSAFRHCVNSFFTETDTSYDKKISFVRLIDELTPTSLLILYFIIENEDLINNHHDENNPRGLRSFPLLYDHFLTKHREIEKTYFRKCVRDLEHHSLIRLSRDFGDWFGGGGFATDERAKNIEILDYARDFIQYISR